MGIGLGNPSFRSAVARIEVRRSGGAMHGVVSEEVS
jgi:hypothetical protein